MHDLQLDQKTSPTLLLAVRSLDDPESWQRFLTTYEPLMVRWLRSKGVPEFAIGEILSDVYVKLVVQLPKFVYDASKSFRAWLKTVVENALLDSEKKAYNRYERTADQASLESLLQWSFSTDDSVEALDEIVESIEQRVALARSIVKRVRKRIAANSWKAFYLTEVEGLSCSEAAQRLRMTEGNVYVARFRVRKQLQKEAVNAENAKIAEKSGADTRIET